MIKKITSTGLRGASQGGLAAGFMMDIPTGGYAPNKFNIPGGAMPTLSALGMEEYDTDKVGQVLKVNLEDADAVIYFGTNEKTTLENKMLELIDEYGVPLLEVNITKPLDKRIVTNFIIHNKVDVLHVTGKTDKKNNKYVYKFVKEYLTSIIKEIRIENSYGHGIY